VNILVATSEAVPFAKTGGLADVCGTLPSELAKLGHQVAVIMPAYRNIRAGGQEIRWTDHQFDVPIGSKIVSGRLLVSQLPESDVPVYLVQQDEYFDRAGLYGEGGDYRDNCERFVFFCRAAMEAIRLLGLNLDVLHCNDWQTGLIPAYLKVEYHRAPKYMQIASLMTIHNMAYQGQFWHWDMLLTGLDWKYFNWRQMEFFGHLNLLKTGLVFADSISTVSPTYAQEIQQHPMGCGLEGVLQSRRDVLSGIINGVDYSLWDPATDSNLEANYAADDWQEGKAQCKAALQREVNLPELPDKPLIGLIGRLTEQKGWTLVADVMQRWVSHMDAQWVILGTGEPYYQELLGRLAAEFPNKVALRTDFNEGLAHRIEAGSDMFVMASRFEPCGLNQLYSLRYGTVPVVRATGGLADTITNAAAETIERGDANGFSFQEFTSDAFDGALREACQTYHDAPHIWRGLVERGMRQDWSWKASARRYVDLYQQTIDRRRG
jgi:starch synthase